MKTTDKNAEIAKFMQYDGHMYDKDLKYHSDWNWLHQAISKIEEIRFVSVYFNKTNLGEFSIEISYHTSGYKLNQLNTTIFIKNKNLTKIEAVHEAVYQFVVWYQKQKQS